jgi:peptide/nickel transport system ATP-binding protein
VELLLRLQAETGIGYLLITHDMRLVKMMASRVTIMYLGEVVEEGTVGDVLTTPLHPYTRSLIDAATLDPDAEERAVVRGEVLEIPAQYIGCRFASRCPFAKQQCQEPQQWREVREGQYVRCWRAGQI